MSNAQELPTRVTDASGTPAKPEDWISLPIDMVNQDTNECFTVYHIYPVSCDITHRSGVVRDPHTGIMRSTCACEPEHEQVEQNPNAAMVTHKRISCH